MITLGLCYRVTLQGRRERVRRAAASHIKPYHLRPPPLRRDFGDEYARFAWELDLGLNAASTLASPLYTLVDHCTIQVPNGSWEWRCRGRYLNSSLSGFITESECLDSFSSTQLDVFHALWELYQQAVNTSQLTEHTLCWRYLSELWFGGTSPTNKEGSNVAGPKSMTKKLHTGGSGTRMETGKR